MERDYSPFTPGQPVPIEFFVGRVAQVRHLSDLTAAASSGRLTTAFLSGERGIGKSSLASFARLIGEREHRALGVHVFLGGVNTLEEMARRVFDRLVKESIGKNWEHAIKDFFGKHVRQVGLFGFNLEFSASDKELTHAVRNFAPSLRNLMEKLDKERQSIFLVLDDINGLAQSEAFANWLKSLVDEIATSQQPLPLCLVLLGLEERRRALINLQPSLARVFDLVEVRTWSNDETKSFFKNAFEKVNMTLEDQALDTLASFAGGLPVLAHEIGDAVFKRDDDQVIDRNDILHGVTDAAEIIGRKHLEPQVLQAIHSGRYRTILRKVAKELGSSFTREELRKQLTKPETRVLDNFLNRMKGLGVIRPDPETGRGAYSFANALHHVYFVIEASRAERSP